MNRTLPAFCIIALALTGCKKAESGSAKSMASPTPARDPVAALKRIAAKFPKGDNFKLDGTTLRLADVSFDVRKTDSLVTPFVGNIDFYALHYKPVEPDVPSLLVNWVPRKVRLELQWRDDRWKMERFTNLETEMDCTDELMRSPEIAAFANAHRVKLTE